MSDIFTLKVIPLTPELGMALKNFRIEKSITAKSIIKQFDKASSYISKLEKGDVKKIDSDFFIDLCNYISNSHNGAKEFVLTLASKYTDFSNETKLIIMNIDDLLIEHNVSSSLVTDIKKYMQEYKISVNDLEDKINRNEDIKDNESYNIAPINQWFAHKNDIEKAMIKLDIPLSYVEDLINGKIKTIHSVIAEAILYSLYRLGNEKNPQLLADSKLKIYNIFRTRRANVIKISEENVDNILGGLEPDDAKALKNVTSGLKVITAVTKGYGSKKIQQIEKNMKEDMGFYFAYMSTDLIQLEQKNKKTKEKFFIELKELIDKYAKSDNSLELYE